MRRFSRTRKRDLSITRSPRLESEVRAHTAALREHEGSIAKHTRLQSMLALLQLVIGAATTAFLLYLTSLQVAAAKFQGQLEKAKSRPVYEVSVSQFMTERINRDARFPKSLTISLTRGEGEIVQAQAYQDISVTIDAEDGQHSCILRLYNYFYNFEHSVSQFTSPLYFAEIAKNPEIPYSRSPPDSYWMFPKDTWVHLIYRNVLGELEERTFSGRGTRLQEVPNGALAALTDGSFEIVPAELYSVDVPIARIWHLSQPAKSKACRSIDTFIKTARARPARGGSVAGGTVAPYSNPLREAPPASPAGQP